MPLYGIVPDGYWPDGKARPWRGVEVIGPARGSFAKIRYQDTGGTATVAISAIYSGNAPIDSPENLKIDEVA